MHGVIRATIAVAAATLAASFASAGAAPPVNPVNHQRPQGPAKVRFARGFPSLRDHEWGFALGGFGGIRPRAPLHHVPVIFVHGNTVDHTDWYPVRDDFRAAGWTDQELWALSYNGLGGLLGAGSRSNPEATSERMEMGSEEVTPATNNTLNVPDLYDFIRAVQTYTGSQRFSIVSHSLGVTVARKTLKVHKELRADLVAFVGIAGGNHGTSLCPPGSEDALFSCDEVEAGSPWLADLNGPNGDDETYAPAKWMTIYDGSGHGDVTEIGPDYAQSPALKGADNRQFPGMSHNDLRLDPAMTRLYRTFIQEAEKPYVASAPSRPRVLGSRRIAGSLPSTGIPGHTRAAAALLGSALALALVLRRRAA
jgi:Lipase (class 2)